MFAKFFIFALCLLSLPGVGWAVKIADVTRLGGQRTNVLVGLGLVVGLKGTGDGGDFAAAINPLAAMLTKFSDPVTARELGNVQNVAVVQVMATIPANGAHKGDKIDVYVQSIGAAASLKGGRLFVTPMLPRPDSEVLGLAAGQLIIEDASTPTVATVKGGLVMEEDIIPRMIENDQIALIIEEPSASWTTASTIAKLINDSESISGEILAVATGPTCVQVSIPPAERQRPDSFISRIQRLPLPLLPGEARVKINERTNTIIVTGDVEISPVVISHKGLTISTLSPRPVPTPRNPQLQTRDVVALDTTNSGGAKLQDLVNALDQLKVPAEDRITIIKELYASGKLHAKLILE